MNTVKDPRLGGTRHNHRIEQSASGDSIDAEVARTVEDVLRH